ncbi:hypothetical protein [Alteriqipengyuania sp.]|uniref:hypothetical protein n=1 Tax=Alteriqipengyuania sp. TaxID=2800692 RepID=UPI00351835F0
MKRIIASLLLGCAIVATPAPALAQTNPAQDAARRDTQSGKALPLRQIEAIVFRTLSAPLCSNVRNSDNCYEYLGPAYDQRAMAYRLKFMRNSRVTFVDVDARTGRVLNRAR